MELMYNFFNTSKNTGSGWRLQKLNTERESKNVIVRTTLRKSNCKESLKQNEKDSSFIHKLHETSQSNPVLESLPTPEVKKRKNNVKNLECRLHFLEKEFLHLKKTIEEDKEEINKKINSLNLNGKCVPNDYENLKTEIIKIIKNDIDIKDEIMKMIIKKKITRSIIPKFPIPKISFKQWYSSFSNDDINTISFLENNLVETIKILFSKNMKKINDSEQQSLRVFNKTIYIFQENSWRKIDIEDGKQFISKIISFFLTNFIEWRIKNQNKIENDDHLALMETKYMKSISIEFKNIEKIFHTIKKWIICKYE